MTNKKLNQAKKVVIYLDKVFVTIIMPYELLRSKPGCMHEQTHWGP